MKNPDLYINPNGNKKNPQDKSPIDYLLILTIGVALMVLLFYR